MERHSRFIIDGMYGTNEEKKVVFKQADLSFDKNEGVLGACGMREIWKFRFWAEIHFVLLRYCVRDSGGMDAYAV